MLQQCPMFRPPRDFTLIEVAIVLVVIGLLLGGLLKTLDVIEDTPTRAFIAH